MHITHIYRAIQVPCRINALLTKGLRQLLYLGLMIIEHKVTSEKIWTIRVAPCLCHISGKHSPSILSTPYARNVQQFVGHWSLDHEQPCLKPSISRYHSHCAGELGVSQQPETSKRHFSTVTRIQRK